MVCNVVINNKEFELNKIASVEYLIPTGILSEKIPCVKFP